MKLVTLLVLCLSISACTLAPAKEEQEAMRDIETVRISPNYQATGIIDNLRVYQYGKRTLVESASINAWDEQQQKISFIKIGSYWVSESVLESFYIKHNGNTVHVQRIVEPVPAPEAPAVVVAPEKPQEPIIEVKQFPELEAASLRQIDQYQEMLDKLANKPSTTGADLFHTQVKQNEIRESIKEHNPIVFVHFASGRTMFEPSEAIEQVMMEAAKDATEIHLRGRTDSVIASKADHWIAKQRAENAKKYLVQHGINASIITVNHLPEGDFLLPPKPATSKAINRRVEIEIRP